MPATKTTGAKKASNGRVTPQDHKMALPKKRSLTKTAWICQDADLAGEYEDAKKKHRGLELRMLAKDTPAVISELDQAASHVEELKAQVREASFPVKLQSIGTKAYDDLANAHPVSEDQYDDIKANGVDEPENFPWNPETFPKALIAASVCNMEATPGEIVAWLDTEDWNASEINYLFEVALSVNTSRAVAELGNV